MTITDKQGINKLEGFFMAKGKATWEEKHPTGWDKNLWSYTSDPLTSRRYKELKRPKHNKIKCINKCDNEVNK